MTVNKAEQIKWLVDWYLSPTPGADHFLCSTNFSLLGLFIDACGVELSDACWRSRIRDAANELGLTGHRLYNRNASPCSGIPLFSVVYS